MSIISALVFLNKYIICEYYSNDENLCLKAL